MHIHSILNLARASTHALFIGLIVKKKSIDKNHWSKIYLHAKSFQIVLAHQRWQNQDFVGEIPQLLELLLRVWRQTAIILSNV